ncbi:MAG TPA: PTS sugar transporter subunit IIA [Chthoniobacterales bacterium]|nr:PTS sugar transporter subunit IIA [Chthoniobacterales bacterium]
MELNSAQVGSLLSLDEQVVREWARAGKLPHVYSQGRYRYNRQAILEWALAHDHPLSLTTQQDQTDRSFPPLNEVFSTKHFYYDVQGANFSEAVRAALDLLDLPPENDKDLIFDLMVSREKLMTTAVGDGVAIPHVRVPVVVNVPAPVFGVFFLRQPIDMNAPDGQPVHTLFVLLSLTAKQHLELLARLAFFFRQPEFIALLRERPDAEIIVKWIGNHLPK